MHNFRWQPGRHNIMRRLFIFQRAKHLPVAPCAKHIENELR